MLLILKSHATNPCVDLAGLVHPAVGSRVTMKVNLVITQHRDDVAHVTEVRALKLSRALRIIDRVVDPVIGMIVDIVVV